MKTIWKFALNAEFGEQAVEMPENAQILSAQMNNNALCIWAIIDDERSQSSYKILVTGTGHEITQKSENLRYIGTVQLNMHTPINPIVLHVFEVVGV